MAFVEGNQDGVLNDTTAVTIVSAPPANSRRIVTAIYISNVDTAQVTLTVRFNRASGTIRRIEPAYAMPVNGVWRLGSPFVLDAINEVVEALLGGAVSANQPEFLSSFADVS